MEEQLPPSGAIWLGHRTAFAGPNASLMPGWWDAKASPLFYLHPLMFAQQGTESGREDEHVDEVGSVGNRHQWGKGDSIVAPDLT